jgi:hypothetical protein
MKSKVFAFTVRLLLTLNFLSFSGGGFDPKNHLQKVANDDH